MDLLQFLFAKMYLIVRSLRQQLGINDIQWTLEEEKNDI